MKTRISNQYYSPVLTTSVRTPVITACRILVTAVVLFPQSVWAYMGPGGGLGFSKSLIIVIIVLIILLISLLSYPIRLILKHLQKNKTPDPGQDSSPDHQEQAGEK